MKRILFSILAAAVAGCSSEPTLTVNVATGLVAGPEFSLVTTELLESNVDLESARTLATHETLAAFGQSFTRGRRVTSFDSVGEGTHTVRVRLYRPDGTLLIQHRTRVTVNDDYVLTIHLTRDCVDVMCPSPGGSAAFSECLLGVCVSPDCIADEPASCAGSEVLFCNDASECSPTAACAQQVCVDGVCEEEARAGACGALEWCDPDPDGGCLPATMLDAGAPLDGGVIDAAVEDGDTGLTVPCGTACTPEGQPCVAGFWDCSSDTPVCARLGQRTTGTECGEGAVCNGVGNCVACRADAPCRIGCAVGHVTCNRGFEECDLDDPTTNAPVATSCADATMCVDGDTCGAGNICNAEGACVPCTNGAACVAECARGTIDCSLGGTCVPDGSYLGTGVSCGSNRYCTAEHDCVDCTPFESCASADPCQISNISCHLGTPTCLLTSGLPAGTVCGTDSVCDWSYTCQHCVEGEVCASPSECGVGTMDSCSSGPSCNITSWSEPDAACADGVCGGNGACYPPLVAERIEVSGQFACALVAGGRVSCWGDNSYGSLGRGTFEYMAGTNLLKMDVGLSDVTAISVGAYDACAVAMGGEVWCWGGNFGGSLGIDSMDSVSVPTHAALPEAATSVTTGFNHTCALAVDGDVYCAGYALYIGSGDDLSTTTFVPVLGVNDAVQIVTSGSTTCARLSDGHIKCWGSGYSGELGDGSTITVEPYGTYEAVDVLDIDDAIDVSLGGSMACAVRSSGEVWCWGAGGAQLFLDPMALDSGMPPTQIPLAFDDVVDVEAGLSRVCVRRAGGEMLCWGDNSSGQAGNGTFDWVMTPTPILYFSDISQISMAMGYSTCVRRSSGHVACFGDNGYGQLGDATYNPTAVPVMARRD